MSTFTAAEIDEQIADIKARLKEAREAASFSLDTGQSKESVTRQSISDLLKDLQYWQKEKELLSPAGSSIQMRRPL